jgi:hypothetical protein
MFFELAEGQAGIIDSVIKIFERSMDQFINPTKCSMFFGSK